PGYEGEQLKRRDESRKHLGFLSGFQVHVISFPWYLLSLSLLPHRPASSPVHLTPGARHRKGARPAGEGQNCCLPRKARTRGRVAVLLPAWRPCSYPSRLLG